MEHHVPLIVLLVVGLYIEQHQASRPTHATHAHQRPREAAKSY